MIWYTVSDSLSDSLVCLFGIANYILVGIFELVQDWLNVDWLTSFLILLNVPGDDTEADLDEPEMAAGYHDEERNGRIHTYTRLRYRQQAHYLSGQ